MKRGTGRKTAYAACALLLVSVAAWMPTAWYTTIPRESAAAALPFSGANFLRLICLAEAIVFIVLAVRDTGFVERVSSARAILPRARELDFDSGHPAAAWILLLITLLALALRVHRLDLDLWIDEISPLVEYGRLSVAQVIGSYPGSNNHLLNTLLTNASVGVWGANERAVRLPAVLFGVMSVPAIYWFGRFGLSRIASLGAALLLACSYHHIFFSQNARGYTAYIFFALVSTGMLLRAQRDDRFWQWGLYVLFATLGMASLLLTAFVLAGHAILAAVIVLRTWRGGREAWPMARRLISVFFAAGLLAVQIYSAALPEAYVTLTTVYARPSTGFALFSSDLVNELIRGVTAGFRSPVVSVAFLVAGVFGFAALLVASWPLAWGLLLPPLLTLLVLFARGLTLSPRFFLLGVPLAMLSAAAAMQTVVMWVRRKSALSPASCRVLFAVCVALVAIASLRSLPYYYRTPKQDYRSAIRFVQALGTRDPVVVIDNAESGIRYYLWRMGAADTARYVYVRSAARFDSVAGRDDGPNTRVVTTFERSLRIQLPAIERQLTGQWHRDTTFSATVGDGEISVWSRRVPGGQR